MEQVYDFKKSSFCSDNVCVEVAKTESGYEVRQSENPDWILRFTPNEWDVFVAGVKNDEF